MTHSVDAGEISVNVAVAGDGPPVLLLHGYPQTHVMWHRVAPVLTDQFTVVCADLRGYGDSDEPRGGGHHWRYFFLIQPEDLPSVPLGGGDDRPGP